MTIHSNIPKKLSHYQLIELLGRGAMGEVWLADDTQLPRQVAIKFLSEHLSGSPEAIARLQREAEATAQIDHPAVVTIYETGQVDGRPYIVMQKVEGDTLDHRLAQGPMAIPEALSFANRIADALAEVHALAIVHRDLKPSNIIMTSRGAKILDFGVASVKSLTAMTNPGDLVGTPLAMSPEQLQGLPADNRADLWALGVILYEVLTGKKPFEGETMESVFNQILNQDPPRPSSLRAEIQPDVDYIVMKLLRKDHSHRYSRAEDLLTDLASAVQAEEPGGAAKTPRRVSTPRLAIMPFEVLSQDPDDTFLALGLVEDLIVDLTRVEGLRVASRGEVAPYSGTPVPPRTLGRELGVDYVLTGSVRRAGNRARISSQLTRAADGHTLWGERFDRTLEDLFDVQSEVSRQIVGALQVALKPEESEMLDRVPTKVTEAYSLYIKARGMMNGSKEENLKAELLLQEAIDLDPEFALAHAGLAECYGSRGLRWWAGIETADLAMECVQRARELEPDLPDADRVELLVQRLKGDAHKIIQTIERILEKNQGDSEGLGWAAWSYLTLNQPEKALPILESIIDRHPQRYAMIGFLASCYQMLGRTEDSERALRLEFDELLEAIRKQPDAPHPRSLLAIMLVRTGERDKGIKQIERAVALGPEDNRIRYNMACFYALAGDKKKAMAQLKDAVRDIPSYVSAWPQHDPDLVSLRDDPEFIRMFGEGRESTP